MEGKDRKLERKNKTLSTTEPIRNILRDTAHNQTIIIHLKYEI